MKWFKHDSDANTDAKLRKLSVRYGLEGYGLYWYCLELVARNVEKHNLTFELEHDSELIAAHWNIHMDKVQEIMRYMVELRLFEDSGRNLTCLKMATRTDEYTQKLMRCLPSVRTLSGESPRKSLLREEKRREEKRKDNTTSRTFTRPTVDEVSQYCISRRNKVDPEAWIDHYTSNGWKVGKNPMKDWKAAVRTWERNDSNGSTKKPRGLVV